MLTDRWLIRDANELLPRDEARRLLLSDESDDRPIVLVSGSGRAEEVEEMRDTARLLTETFSESAHAYFSSPIESDEQVNRWPLLQLFAGIDVIVGAGGYNTVSEARATGIPLIAFARGRMYDRQRLRLLDDQVVTCHDDLLLQLQDALKASTRRRQIPSFTNGTHQAVEFVKGTA